MPSEVTKNPSENAPRGIYKGWIVVAVSFLSIGGSIGFAQYGFGLFIVPLQEEFGWTRTQINFALTLGVLAHFLSPLIGRTIDIFGSRYVMAGSLGFIAVGLFLRSIMVELWQFYFFSLLIFAGAPGTGLATGRLVQLWFPETRGRMMGFVTAGNNFGGMVSIPVLTLLIAFGGWRSGFLFTAIVLGILSIASFIFVRDGIEFVLKEQNKRWAPRGLNQYSSKKVLEGLSVRSALLTRAFWFIAIGMTLQQFVRTTLVTQLAAHLQDIQLSADKIGLCLTVLAFGGVASKVIFGRVSENTTARWAYAMVVGIQVIGVAAFIFFSSDNFILIFISLLVFGLGMGGIGALGPLAVTELFGMKNYGTLNGLIRQGVIIPGIVGPLLAGAIYDSQGSYDLAFKIILGFLFLSFVCFVLASPPAREEYIQNRRTDNSKL